MEKQISLEDFQKMLMHQEEDTESDIEALNARLKEMSPEDIVARIKGIVYRNLSTITLCDQHYQELSMSEKLMGDTTQQIFGALLDSLKWICMKHQVDVNAPYGDDTLIHQVADLRFGVPLEEDEEEPNEPMSEETEEPGFEWDDITSKDE
jgi:hypothetical protein